MNIKGKEFLLDPLCEATRLALKELSLGPSDRIDIALDSKGRKFLMKLRSVGADGKDLFLGPTVGAMRFFDRLPEATHLGKSDLQKKNQWSVGATDYTALLIHHCWPADRITFIDSNAEQMYTYLLTRFVLQHHRAAIAARYKELDEVPPLPPDWIEHPELPLSPYQKTAAVMFVGQDAGALFMDKGTGKTAPAINIMCLEARRKRRDTGKMLLCLIVCPAQVCLNWKLEIQRFATVPGKVVVIRGGPEERIKSLIEGVTSEDDCDFSAVIIGYDSLSASEDVFCQVLWDRIIADESHGFKSPDTNRWKTMRRLAESAKRRLILTGTPIGNTPMDLWTQLEFMGEGLSGFQDYKRFRTFHGQFERVAGASGHGVNKLVGIRNVPLLQERLARISFAVTKDEAKLQLPDKVYDVVEVQMTPRQAEIYNKVASQLAVQIEDILSKEVNQLTAEHILTMLMRLAQVTSGFIVYDQVIDPDTGDVVKPRRVAPIDEINPKVQAVLDDVLDEDRDPLAKTIVWACFIEDIKALEAGLKAKGVECGSYYGATKQDARDEAVRRFNCDPNFKVLIANPQTAGEGLDLLGYDKTRPDESATYCDRELFVSQNWSAILRSQAEDRAHRRGTRMPVIIRDIVVPGTIDEEIRKRVNGKMEMAKAVTDLREILKAVLGGTRK